jgi:nitrate reductase NapD
MHTPPPPPAADAAAAPAAAPAVREELHIASLVVYTTPSRGPLVAGEVLKLDGAEVHAESSGKLVVTLEAATADEMIDKVRTIQHIDGVLSAPLVYQHVEDLDTMNEEIPDADR